MSNNGDNNGDNNDNAPTTTSQITIPATAPEGQIVITQPPQTATSFYKIAPSNLVTFGWNTSYISIIEGSLTVSAFCNNGYSYPVGPSDGVIPPDAMSVVWDPYAWQTAHPEQPLPNDVCTLGIADARDFTARRRGGYLSPNTMLQFALYTPVAYTPLASGHVYCLKCITDVVNRPENETTSAQCPTCRSDFHLVVPDLTLLPKKYHPFITRPVRRIFVDTDPAEEVQSKRALERDIVKLKARITALQASEEKLMQYCERHQAKARAYREREHDARLDNERLEEQCKGLVKQVSKFETDMSNAEIARVRLQEKGLRQEMEIARLKKENEALRRQAEQAESKPRAVSRPVPLSRRMSSGVFSIADGPESSDEELQGDTNKRRITRPLPRRTRYNTGLQDLYNAITAPKAPAPKKPRLDEMELSTETHDQLVPPRRSHRRAPIKMEEISDDGWPPAFL
ncbi:hypothetical protein MD484_g3363, partial [Candolleomyces efflorescens]